MSQRATFAMPLKGDLAKGRRRGALTLHPGEVAEWLKAAPC
jgi:hypothetical protein